MPSTIGVLAAPLASLAFQQKLTAAVEKLQIQRKNLNILVPKGKVSAVKEIAVATKYLWSMANYVHQMASLTAKIYAQWTLCVIYNLCKWNQLIACP